MATEATAVTAPNPSEIIVAPDGGLAAAASVPMDAAVAVHSDGCVHDDGAGDSPKPTGLHSPPDSNNAMKLDGSDDSELSDIDESVIEGLQPIVDRAATELPTLNEKNDKPDVAIKEEVEEEDIGEVVPDHWSGTVPVFRPTMFQFKDFTKFVCCPA